MKKLKYACIFVLTLLLNAAVYAGSQEIVLGELRATLTLPDGWEQLEEEGVLLAANGPEGIRMTLSSQSGDVSKNQWNLALYEDSQCEELGEALVETLTEGGYENVVFQLYKKEQATWLRFTWELTSDDGTHYGVQYYTAMNGQAITMAFSSHQAIETGQTEPLIDGIFFAEIQDPPSKSEKDWTTRIIWISLLIVAGAITYMITSRRGKR